MSPGNTGVKGESTSQFGVHGASQSHAGVGGITRSSSGYGVWGQSTPGIGVFGNSVNNIGVYANSTTNSAVYATSPARGVWGRSTNGIGVLAQATAGGTVQNRSYGLYAAAPSPGWAGYFEGNVFVTGGVFTPVGQLSMAQAADGSQRTLYSQDSTEPVVEDFGSGTLANGVAEVKLDPDFAAVVTSDAYMVFLTEEGAHSALFVEKKTPAGFTVRAQGAPTATGAFVYRVVAKRKGATGKRLERVEHPKGLSASERAPPKLPEPPTQPEKPPTAPKPEPPTSRPPTAR